MNVEELGGELALAINRGDKGAVERLVHSYQDALFGYALRLLQDPADAQEVAQDAFLRAVRALSSYDEERCRALKLEPWLFRIARNLCYNRFRSRRSVPREPLPEPDGYHEPALRSSLSVEENLGARDQLAELTRAVARLNRASREVIQLRFVEELSYAEIAAMLGGSEASVRARVFRALGRLRSRLTQREVTHAM